MIKGQRVILRAIEKTDIILLNKWKNDEEVFKYLGGGFLPTSINIQEKWLEEMMDTTNKNIRLVITDVNGMSVGLVGIYSINWIHRVFEIGVFIGETSERNKGYASEAISLIEKYAKSYMNLRKAKIFVVDTNVAAKVMWKKLNYITVGIYKQERFIDGQYHDLVIMEKFI